MIEIYKRLRVVLYVLLVIILGDIISYIALDASNVLSNYHYLEIIFAVTTPTLVFIWSFILALTLSYKSTIKQLFYDNRHYLGQESVFYNLEVFEKKLKVTARKRRKENAYIIVFTACTQETSTNLIRNDSVTKFNYLISEMILEYFKTNKIYPHADHVACYDKNRFIMYVVGDEDRINKIVKQFEMNIYDIAKNNSIRIFVQPFFGISRYENETSFTTNIENASLAKNSSEKHFELATYFNTDLRYKGNADESQEIVDALKNKEFLVYYQPKFNLESKRFISSEALVRWNSSKYGLLSPARFIDKAEAAGLIHDIDMYVFQKVCEDLNDIKKRGKRLLPVSINFSLYEFYSPTFVQDVLKIIDSNNIPHNLVEIEITETTSQSNPFLSISIMKQLKEQGIRILMDDFGIGYSNFSNLRKMPIDSIKIDKAFIDDIVFDNKTREIVKFLIQLGRNNGLEVIAEGVDSKEQVEILKKCGLDTIQGFYYSKPIPKKDFEAFLYNNQFEKKGGTLL